MNLNRAELIGRVTRDPELRSMQNGSSVASFGVATNYSYTDKTGTKIEKVSFHNCTIFGKGAEIFSKYVTKGQEVYVAGRLEYQEWEKKEGGKGNKTVIMVEDFQFGQRAKGGNSSEGEQPDPGDDGVDQSTEEKDEIKIEDAPF